jgi:hypothetical protein
MPRGGVPEYKKRLEPIMDDHVMMSISQANGIYDPDTGHYAHLVYAGCKTEDYAANIVKAINRSPWHLNKKLPEPIGVTCKIRQAKDGTYNVEFFAVNKAHTYKYMIDTYGSDPSKWPYDPREKRARKY